MMKKHSLIIGTMMLIVAFCMVGPVSAKIEEHWGDFNTTVYTKEDIPVRVHYFIAWQYDPQPGNCSSYEKTATSFIIVAGKGIMSDEFAKLTIKEALQSKNAVPIGAIVMKRTNEAVGLPECSPKITRFTITSIEVPQLSPPKEPNCPTCDCRVGKLVADQIIIGFLTIWVIFFALVAILLGIALLIYYMFIEKGETSEKKQ